MKVKDVVTLKEVANDLNDGKAFYDQTEAGVGDYFWDSLVADIESLIIYAGIHNKLENAKAFRLKGKGFKPGEWKMKSMVFIECSPSDFPMPSITKLGTKLLMLSQCYPCVEILHGLRAN